MKLIPYSVHTGAENMQIDLNLLEELILSKTLEPVFRLYGWSPKCISLGRNQKGDKFNKDIDCVRRLTGGRALLHDDEVTYSCVFPVSIIPNGDKVTESYSPSANVFIRKFRCSIVARDITQRNVLWSCYSSRK